MTLLWLVVFVAVLTVTLVGVAVVLFVGWMLWRQSQGEVENDDEGDE